MVFLRIFLRHDHSSFGAGIAHGLPSHRVVATDAGWLHTSKACRDCSNNAEEGDEEENCKEDVVKEDEELRKGHRHHPDSAVLALLEGGSLLLDHHINCME